MNTECKSQNEECRMKNEEGRGEGMSEDSQESGVRSWELEKGERDYTRHVYQNLMAVVELLEAKAPLPVTQGQIQKDTGISKNVVFDICWNLCKRGWAEEAGEGAIRLKRAVNDKEGFIGRMVIRLVKDNAGFEK